MRYKNAQLSQVGRLPCSEDACWSLGHKCSSSLAARLALPGNILHPHPHTHPPPPPHLHTHSPPPPEKSDNPKLQIQIVGQPPEKLCNVAKSGEFEGGGGGV